MPYNDSELAKIAAEVRRPFQQSGTDRQNRDQLWDRRRNTRHRRAKPWLPADLDQFQGQVIYRDSLAGFYVEMLKQRLGVNAATYEVKGEGDPGPDGIKSLAKIENWYRGADSQLDPLGQVDGRLRDHAAGDGIGFVELEFLPSYVPPRGSGSMSNKEYAKLDDSERRKYGLPYRISAPDPRGLSWLPVDVTRGLKVMVKSMDVPLVDIQDRWRAEDIRLSYNGPENPNENGSISVDQFIYGSEQAPSPTSSEYGRLVRFVLIEDGANIYHCVSPVSTTNSAGFIDSPGAVQSLILIKAYPNPIGRPAFFPATGRVTSDPDPAYMYQPLAMEVLDQSEYVSQTMTIEMQRAFLEALKPWPIQLNNPNVDLKNLPDKIRPGWMVIPFGASMGTFPENRLDELHRVWEKVQEVQQSFNMSISQSAVVGKSTPAWSLNIMGEEQMTLIKESIDSRASCKRDYLMAIAECTRQKHAKDGPVYVRSQMRSTKHPESGKVDMYIGLTKEELSIPHRLEVGIEAQTQSQRASHTEYGARLEEKGAISHETFVTDFTPVDDPVMEQRRIDRERLRANVGDPVLVAKESVREALLPIYGRAIDVALGPSPFPVPPGTDPSTAKPIEPGEPTGAEPGGQPTPPGQMDPNPPYPVGPGLGMDISQPVPPATPAANGVRPAIA